MTTVTVGTDEFMPGQKIRITCQFDRLEGSTDVVTSANLQLTLVDPALDETQIDNGDLHTSVVANVVTGYYEFVLPDQPGVWGAEWRCSGDLVAVGQEIFRCAWPHVP